MTGGYAQITTCWKVCVCVSESFLFFLGLATRFLFALHDLLSFINLGSFCEK